MPVRKDAILSQILIFFFVLSGFSNTVYAKSIYAITKYGQSTLTAYDINGTQIDYQTALDVYQGAIGLALDPATSTLFISYDGEDRIEMVYAKTMEEIKYIETPAELAGIVFDETKQKVYAVSRERDKLYVYLWNPFNKTLSLDGDRKILQNIDPYNGAFGLALDENEQHLFVTDKTNAVKYYDTNDPDFGYLGSVPIVVDVNREAVGIAFYNDGQGNKYLYTGAYVHVGLHDFLVRTDINDIDNPTSVEKNIGSSVIGITVDQGTGLVYVTDTNNNIEVFDNSTFPSDRCYIEDANISGPADIIVAGDVYYKPRRFIVVKDNNDPNNDCVYPWNSLDENYLVYDICYDANGHADTNAVITDYLALRHDGHPLVWYYSSEPCGTYDANEHTVIWDINDLGANDSNCIRLTVKVTGWAASRYTIWNLVVMEGDNYYGEAMEDVGICAGTGTVLHVDKDANGLNDGRTWDDAYTDLQDALAAACNDFNVGAIWVAGGNTYKPTWDPETMTGQETFKLIEGVGLFGHFGGIGTYETSTQQRNFADANNETILDGQIGENYWEAVARVVTAEDVNGAILDGFTIQGSWQGRGIRLDSADVSIVNCKVKYNSKGIECLYQSQADIHNCTFISNGTDGVYSSTSSAVEISNCIFDGGGSTYRGLYSASSNAAITDCVFRNHTDDGIKASNTELFVTECNFEGNDDNGIEASNSDLTIDHSVIARSTDNGLYTSSGCALTLTNSVVRYSGEHGISLNSNTAATTIKDNWIHNSGGAGIYFNNQAGVPLVRNNTIYDNFTYGIESGSAGADPNIVNCIIYGNGTGDLYRPSGTFDVDYCCLQSEHSGQGNIVADPYFINATDPNDLHISEDSPCKDAGDPNVDYGDETDIDGEARVRYGRVDMGADEYYWSAADLNRDETVNFIDYCEFALAWRTAAGEPNYNDDCDLEDNNSIDYNDLDLFCEDWLWEAAWGDSQWMMCMGGRFGGESLDGSELMIPDAVESLKAMPERLAAKVRKFYDVTPATTIAARQGAPEIDIKAILEWLDGLWFDGILEGTMTEDEYLKFRKAIQESVE